MEKTFPREQLETGSLMVIPIGYFPITIFVGQSILYVRVSTIRIIKVTSSPQGSYHNWYEFPPIWAQIQVADTVLVDFKNCFGENYLQVGAAQGLVVYNWGSLAHKSVVGTGEDGT